MRVNTKKVSPTQASKSKKAKVKSKKEQQPRKHKKGLEVRHTISTKKRDRGLHTVYRDLQA